MGWMLPVGTQAAHQRLREGCWSPFSPGFPRETDHVGAVASPMRQVCWLRATSKSQRSDLPRCSPTELGSAHRLPCYHGESSSCAMALSGNKSVPPHPTYTPVSLMSRIEGTSEGLCCNYMGVQGSRELSVLLFGRI